MAARGKDIIFTVFGVGLIFFVFVVLWRVLFPPEPVQIVIQADTPAESFSAASALAMGERMGQSAEWTIATVLVIGSALIGLNWYQGDRRHQHDMAELEKKIAALKATMESRLGVIEFATVGTLEYMNYKSIDEALGDPSQFGYVRRAIELYRTAAAPPMRRAVASILVGFAQSLRRRSRVTQHGRSAGTWIVCAGAPSSIPGTG